jgi:hypothetical protein
MALQEELLRALRMDSELRDAVRRELLTEELLAVPARLEALTLRVEALAAAQQRTEERLEALAAAQLRTEERLAALTAQVGTLVNVVEGIAREVAGLSDWRRGEEGRREGERYERITVRHAYAIFNGGRGATERPEDLERIRRALAPAAASPAGLDEDDDPFLTDLLWVKDDRIAVVEISRRIDHEDMERAERRAAVLRSGGLEAVGMVIGRDWASEEAERAARARPIEWRVGEDQSAGYLELRRMAAA